MKKPSMPIPTNILSLCVSLSKSEDNLKVVSMSLLGLFAVGGTTCRGNQTPNARNWESEEIRGQKEMRK